MDAGVLLVAGAITIAAFVQGYAGFGFGIVAMALLAFLPVQMERAAAVANAAGVVQLSILLGITWRRYGVVWRQALVIALGAAAGLPLGYAFIVTYGDAPLFGVCLGVVLMVFAAQGLVALRRSLATRPWPRWLAFPVGVSSGLLGGAFVSGGPPVVLYLTSRVEDPRTMKATIQLVFLIGMCLRLALVGGGPVGLDRDLLVAAAVAVAPVLLAIVVGHRLSQRAGVATFRRVIFCLIGLAGITLLLRHGRALLAAA